jgi:inorganic pyrophosphatase
VGTTKEIQRFFQDYKKLENRKVEIEEFAGKEKAFEIIQESIEGYKAKFGK